MQDVAVMPKSNNAAIYNMLDGNKWVIRDHVIAYREYSQ
jgi:hypothetical protein